MTRKTVIAAVFAVLFACLCAGAWGQSQPRLIVGHISSWDGSANADLQTIISLVERVVSGTNRFRVISHADWARMGEPNPADTAGKQLLQRERIDYEILADVRSTYTGYEFKLNICTVNELRQFMHDTYFGKSSTEMYAGIQEAVNTLISRIVSAGLLPYAVGDRGPAGGWVFYDKGSYSDGWRYLEAAPKEAEFEFQTGDTFINFEALQEVSTKVGFGKRNTQMLVDWSRRNSNRYGGSTVNAAKQCVELRFGGYNDWFMPSMGELSLMSKNLAHEGIGEFNGIYHDSSQNGIIFTGDRIGDKVRPVRQF